MKLSSESLYGLKGLLFLAQQPAGSILPLNEIANASGLPRSFLAKIFQKFVQHGLVKSFRGASRGYALARPPKQIKTREVLEAIEGPDVFQRCIFWNDRCSDDNPCPLHEGWGKVRPRFVEMTERVTLAELSQGSVRWTRLARRRKKDVKSA